MVTKSRETQGEVLGLKCHRRGSYGEVDHSESRFTPGSQSPQFEPEVQPVILLKEKRR